MAKSLNFFIFVRICLVLSFGIVKVSKMALQSKKRKLRILLCPDKFKGGLNSLEVASAIREGLEKRLSSSASFETLEMADGGDGSADIFGKILGAEKVECRVCGPLGNQIDSYYMLCRDGGEHPVAFVECAKACGLALVPRQKRNPLVTTTFGVGELIRDALEKGARTVYIGVGGTSSNDLGCGMLQGLGFSVGLPSGIKACGGNLGQIAKVEDPLDAVIFEKIKSARFIIINDVDNPLCGPEGAAQMYSPQKGADRKTALRLDEEARAFLTRCGRTSFSRTGAIEASLFQGAGTAGGMGFGLMHFLGAESIGGFRFFGDVLQNISSKIAEADIIITGEGSLDSQSLQGKVIGGLCSRLLARPGFETKRLWLFCGRSLLKAEELFPQGGPSVKIFQLSDIEPDIKKRIGMEKPLLEKAAIQAAEDLGASF